MRFRTLAQAATPPVRKKELRFDARNGLDGPGGSAAEGLFTTLWADDHRPDNS